MWRNVSLDQLGLPSQLLAQLLGGAVSAALVSMFAVLSFLAAPGKTHLFYDVGWKHPAFAGLNAS